MSFDLWIHLLELMMVTGIGVVVYVFSKKEGKSG